MNDRRLLFSLLALPACGPAVSTEADDPRIPDGGDPAKIESSCKAAYQTMYACYEEIGYDSSGGAYGSSGDYDPADYAEAFCDEIQQYVGEYGPGCAGAYEEVFACLASLDCAAILGELDGGGFAPEPCRAVFVDANERCPESFPYCNEFGVSFGGGCEQSASGCLDESTYTVRCEEPGATQSCECERNGEVVQSVTLSGNLSCGTQEFLDEINDACGFPPGVF